MRVKSGGAKPKRSQASYHHGDLRRSLLDAAVLALGSQEPAELSLAQLARDAGVSSGAPYHHFRDRSELIAMVAREGFDLLREQLLKSANGCAPGEDVIDLYTRTYIRFGRLNWSYYKVMFDPEVTLPQNVEHVREPAEACFGMLMAALAAKRPREPAPRRLRRSIAAWSLLHGLVDLYFRGPLAMKVGEKDLEDIALAGVRSIADK